MKRHDPLSRHVAVARDPRLRAVRWRDLVSLSRFETARELTLCLPWLASSLVLADAGYFPAAMAASFMFFLTALRQVHNAFHGALGVGRVPTDIFLFAMSLVMLGSNHAVKFNHLRHHRYCLGDEDVEAAAAHMTGLRALLFGPAFPFLLVRSALHVGGPVVRRWVRAELALNVVWISAVLLWFGIDFLIYHVTVMLVAQSLTAFFAVWIVHRDSGHALYPARTQRGAVTNFLSYNMFRHAEHHLYPLVPTCHLARLSARIDEVLPELSSSSVVDLPWFRSQSETGEEVLQFDWSAKESEVSGVPLRERVR